MGGMTNIPPRRFGSLAAAMVTPMTEVGDIDLPSAQRLAIKLVDEGCDTILLRLDSSQVTCVSLGYVLTY